MKKLAISRVRIKRVYMKLGASTKTSLATASCLQLNTAHIMQDSNNKQLLIVI